MEDLADCHGPLGLQYIREEAESWGLGLMEKEELLEENS